MGKLNFGYKKSIGLYVLILCNLFMVPFFQTRAMTKEEGIKHAFERSGASLIEVNMNAQVKMMDKGEERIDVVNLCQTTAKILDLSDTKIQYAVNEVGEEAWIQESDHEKPYVRIAVHRSAVNGNERMNLIVDVIQKKKQTDIGDVASKITDMLDAYGRVNMTSYIVGSYQGKLQQSKQRQIVQTIFEELGANEIEGVYESNLVSVVGYTKKMNDWIQYGGKKANLHIAMRYNAYEDKTMIWFGTPLITIAY
ncbi:MAG: YwmB family TATA-box binding protein [Bacillota bacterium]